MLYVITTISKPRYRWHPAVPTQATAPQRQVQSKNFLRFIARTFLTICNN